MVGTSSPGRRRSRGTVRPGDGDDSMREIKRVKLENARRRREETPMDEDVNGEADADADMDDRDPSSDEGEGDGEDLDDVDKNIAAYMEMREQSKRRQGIAPTCGFIKSIHVQDFMCHANLSLNLASKLNFLVGHNGSGKSAILTAIAVGLGAKAGFTGRGSSLKELIKQGKSKALVKIVLANMGVDAFEHDKYGDEIIIERHITRNGANYKLRAEKNGKVIDEKKEVVSAITSHFSIDIESPLTILTQDAAKSFIATTEAHKLYSFFFRGTGLETLKNSYQSTESAMNRLEFELRTASQIVPLEENKAKRLKEKLASAKAAGNLKNELVRVNAHAMWAHVAEREKRHAKALKEMDNIIDAKQKVVEHLAKIEADKEPTARELEELKKELEEHTAKRASVQQKLKEATKECERIRGETREADGALGDIDQDIVGTTRVIQELKDKIAANDKHSRGEISPKELELREAITKHERLISNMRRAIPGLQRQLQGFEQQLESIDAKRDGAARKRDGLTQKLRDEKDKMDTLRKGQSDRLAVYGQRLDLVLREISHAKWHHSPPIGPLGQYVELTDRRYSRLVEAFLGQYLCTFAVRDSRDKAQLQDILQRCARNGYSVGGKRQGLPTIIQHTGDMFDYSSGDLSKVAPTLLSVLKVSDPVVLRILINATKMEQIFVSPDKHQADKLLDSLRHRPDMNTVTVYSAEPWNQRGTKTSKTSSPVQAWQGASLFVEDRAHALRAASEIVAQLETERDAAKDEFSALTTEANGIDKQMKLTRQQLEKAEGGIPKTEQAMNVLKDQLAELQPVDGDAHVSALADAEAELAKLETLRATQIEQVKETRARLAEAEARHKELYEEDKDFIPGREAKETAISALLDKQVRFVTHERHWNKYSETVNTKEEEVAAKIAITEEEVAKWSADAAKAGPRPDTLKPSEVMITRKKALEKQLAEAEKRSNIDYNKVLAEYNAAEDALEKRKGGIRNLRMIASVFKSGIALRQDRWLSLRQALSVRTKAAFAVFLLERGFLGHIDLDHDDGTLKLSVATAEVEGPGKTVTLSGGERSFTTVSFLLAMWESISSKLRCLDEWDVFLDMVNRQRAAKLLIDGAKQAEGKQYILITPQDMGGNLNLHGPDVKVLRMPDPDRNQRTLHDVLP